MSLNWVALVLVVLAVFAVVMGVKGTYPQVWAQIKALTHPVAGDMPGNHLPPSNGGGDRPGGTLPHPGAGGMA